MSFSSIKKVRMSTDLSFSSPGRLRNFEKKRTQRFDTENVEKTLRPAGKGYGLMKIDGSSTPFTRRAQSLDSTYLRDRLLNLLKQQELQYKNKVKDDENEDEDEEEEGEEEQDEDDDDDDDKDEDQFIFLSPPTSDLSYSLTFSPGKERDQLSFQTWRKLFDKADFSLPKCGIDMRRIMHDPGPRVPGVSIKFPPVSLPTDYHEERRTVLFDTEVKEEET